MSIILYDNFCEFCTAWANFISKRSRGNIRLVGQETQEGVKILESKPDNLEGVDSVFLVDERGHWFSKSTAALRIAMKMRFPWSILSLGLLMPKPIRDFAYDAYAKRRFRVGGI